MNDFGAHFVEVEGEAERHRVVTKARFAIDADPRFRALRRANVGAFRVGDIR
jgi:hypothetical protein